jgi:hypothetical protein
LHFQQQWRFLLSVRSSTTRSRKVCKILQTPRGSVTNGTFVQMPLWISFRTSSPHQPKLLSS